MLRRIIKMLKESVAMKRIALGVFAVVLYFMLIGLASELIDQKSLEQDLKQWFEDSLNMSTYVNIDHTDTALRSDWRTDLYIHEFEIASPQPEFMLPILSVDTIRASSSLYSLFGGVEANPVIQIRDGILNITKKPTGLFNLSGLTVTPEPQAPYFLPNIDLASAVFILMNCRVELNLNDYLVSIPLNGRLSIDNTTYSLQCDSEMVKFTYRFNNTADLDIGSIQVKQLQIDRQTLDIISCEITVDNIPTYILNMLLPNLPALPTDINFSGKLDTEQSQLRVSGILDNAEITEFPRYLDFNLATNNSLLRSVEYLSFNISANNSIILNYDSNKDEQGRWLPLQLCLSTLDISELLSSSESYWLNYFISKFPAISAIVSSAKTDDFNIGQAIIKTFKSDSNEINIALDGMIAGGKLSLLAQNLSLKENIFPETIMATLEIKDAASTLLNFSKILPEVMDCTPTTGSGELALLYNRDLQSGEEKTNIQLTLANVVIPTLSSGTAISTLASVPTTLNTLNRLCFDPLNSPESPMADLIQPFQSITLDTLLVNYQTSNAEQKQLSSLKAFSKELGIIHGSLFRINANTLRFILNLDKLPQPTVQRSQLSPNALAAYRKFTANNPLTIDLTEDSPTTHNTSIFIEDIFRSWLDTESLKANNQGENR